MALGEPRLSAPLWRTQDGACPADTHTLGHAFLDISRFSAFALVFRSAFHLVAGI